MKSENINEPLTRRDLDLIEHNSRSKKGDERGGDKGRITSSDSRGKGPDVPLKGMTSEEWLKEPLVERDDLL